MQENIEIFPTGDYIMLEPVSQGDTFVNTRAFNKFVGSFVILKYAIFNRADEQFDKFTKYLDLLSTNNSGLFLQSVNIYRENEQNDEDAVTFVLLMQHNVASLKKILEQRRSKYQPYTEPELIHILLKWVQGFRSIQSEEQLLSKATFNLDCFMVVPEQSPCELDGGVFETQTHYSYKISNFDYFEGPCIEPSPEEILKGLATVLLELMGLENMDLSSEEFVNFPNLGKLLRSISKMEISLEELESALQALPHFPANEDAFWPVHSEIVELSELERVKALEEYCENYNNLGFYTFALDHALSRLEYYRNVANGKNSPQLAKVLNDVGVIYWRLREFQKAKEILLECSQMLKSLYGETHLSLAICFNNLALVFEELKDFDQAQQFFNSSYSIKLALENFEFLPCYMNNFANFLEKTGLDDEKAKENYENALEIKANFGFKAGSLSISLNNFAVFHANRGNLDKALELAEKQREALEQINVADENYIIFLNNYAFLSAQKGLIPEAMNLYASAATLLNKQARNKSLLAASVLGNYSHMLYQMGDFHKCAIMLEKVIEIKSFLLGVYNISYAISANNLGETYLRLEKYEEAASFLEKSFEIKSQFLDPNDAKLVNSLNNLGLAYVKLKRFEKAGEFLYKALTIDENNLAALNNWALMFSLSEQYPMAISQYQKALAKVREIKGESCEEIVKIYNNLAALYVKNKEWELAEEHLRNCLEVAQKAIPEKVEFLAKCKERLEQTLAFKEKALL